MDHPLLLARNVVVAFVSLAGCASPPPTAKVRARPTVSVIHPVVRALDITLTYPAEIEAEVRADIHPVAVSGHVLSVEFDRGESIERGDIIAKIDCAEEDARLRQQREALRSAAAQSKQDQRTVNRLRPMRAQRFISAQELDIANANAEASSARVANLRARLEEARSRSGYCVVVAPFDGEVTMRFVDPGALVSPATPIVTLMNIDTVRVIAHVTESDVPRLRLQQPAIMKMHGPTGITVKGEVTRFVSAADPRTRTVRVEVDLENPGHRLLPGLFGRLMIVVARHE